MNPLLGRIHMKHQALFSSKDKSKKNKLVLSAANLFGALRVKIFLQFETWMASMIIAATAGVTASVAR